MRGRGQSSWPIPRSSASQKEDVSIYLGTRSRRINGSGAGNLSRCVCRRDPLEFWQPKGMSTGPSLYQSFTTCGFLQAGNTNDKRDRDYSGTA
ncbi:unnamed protein product [Lasius platythorax]|uniref:Uncharacterized protein n=1 Tax=Lasius platythorax TaxID=488582 RepID=A0AAV2NN81_9HYME